MPTWPPSWLSDALDAAKRAPVVAMARQEVGRNEIARAVCMLSIPVTRMAKNERPVL